jgi:tRNA threonylcarbamoyl adenosine modification protein (Sua5/YciO/YrdC/YwlC family)
VIISVHPQNPQPRQIQRVVDMLRKGEIIAYPTDTLFGIGCDVLNQRAIEAVSRVVGRDKTATFSFICTDFRQADQFAMISKSAFRIMRHALPGPYTFILPATGMVPRKVAKKRRTVGIRIPDHRVCEALAGQLGRPIANVSFEPEDHAWAGDAYSVEAQIGNRVAAVIDAGTSDTQPSTVIDLTQDKPCILRKGKGGVEFLEWAGS